MVSINDDDYYNSCDVLMVEMTIFVGMKLIKKCIILKNSLFLGKEDLPWRRLFN